VIIAKLFRALQGDCKRRDRPAAGAGRCRVLALSKYSILPDHSNNYIANQPRILVIERVVFVAAIVGAIAHSLSVASSAAAFAGMMNTAIVRHPAAIDQLVKHDGNRIRRSC